jgi:hypothetical protein
MLPSAAGACIKGGRLWRCWHCRHKHPKIWTLDYTPSPSQSNPSISLPPRLLTCRCASSVRLAAM